MGQIVYAYICPYPRLTLKSNLSPKPNAIPLTPWPNPVVAMHYNPFIQPITVMHHQPHVSKVSM